MVLSSETLVTDVTQVRSLISVSPLMNQQIVGLCEMPTTESADELFSWPATQAIGKNLTFRN